MRDARTGSEGRRRGGSWEAVANLARDLRIALRRLGRAPLFGAVVVLTLAVGIGANTAIFSLVKGILLDPLPYPEPERLVSVLASAPGQGQDELRQSAALHLAYEDEAELVERIGLWRQTSVTMLGFDEPVQLSAMLVTDGTLPALRVRPAIGRLFRHEDDIPEAPATAVVSHAYWQSQFGGEQDIIGRTIDVSGRRREIIGVLPRGFRFLDLEPAIYLPFRLDRSTITVSSFTISSLVRLKPDVTLEEATADLARLVPRAVEKFPGGLTQAFLDEARMTPVLRPLKDTVVGDVGTILWTLLGTVGITLLIACANVANLVLVRAEGRQREFAVRTAIGAGGRRLAGQLLVESLVLGLLGGLGGLALAFGGLRLVVAMAPPELPRLNAVTIDGWTLGFTAVLSVLSGILFSLWPMLQVGRVDLITALKEGGRSGDGSDRNRTRSALVVGQIALALVLLVAAGLMIRSAQAIRSANAGFTDPEQVLILGVTVSGADVADPSEVAERHELISRRLTEVPGVTTVGLSSSVAMDGGGGFDPVYVEDFPLPDGQLPPTRRFKWIGEGYFESMGNPLVAGRSLTWADIHSRARVLVVTEDFAREYWGAPADALGKRIGTGQAAGNWRQIIGVVGNVRDDGVTQGSVPVIYWPMLLKDFWAEESGQLFVARTMRYAIRSPRVGTPEFLESLKAAVWSVQPQQALTSARTMQDIVRGSMARTAFALAMLSLAAAVALLLAAVGVYGVLSHAVMQRTREIGVRIALGAESSTVIGMVLWQGLMMSTIGVTSGLIAAFWLTRLMSGLLVDVGPLDVATYAVVSACLMAVALAASYLPARRASRVDPIAALRAE